MEINAKNAGLACQFLVDTPPQLREKMIEFVPLLLSDKSVSEKVDLVMWGNQPFNSERVMRFTLCDEDGNLASLIPAWDRLLAASIIADPENAHMLLKRLSDVVLTHHDDRFNQSRHGYIFGTLRALVTLDSIDQQATSTELLLDKIFSAFLSSIGMPELSEELSSEQSTLLAAFMKPPHRRGTLVSMAREFASGDTYRSPGALQFIDNFNYKYFGRLESPFKRARLIADSVP